MGEPGVEQFVVVHARQPLALWLSLNQHHTIKREDLRIVTDCKRCKELYANWSKYIVGQNNYNRMMPTTTNRPRGTPSICQ